MNESRIFRGKDDVLRNTRSKGKSGRDCECWGFDQIKTCIDAWTSCKNECNREKKFHFPNGLQHTPLLPKLKKVLYAVSRSHLTTQDLHWSSQLQSTQKIAILDLQFLWLPIFIRCKWFSLRAASDLRPLLLRGYQIVRCFRTWRP